MQKTHKKFLVLSGLLELSNRITITTALEEILNEINFPYWLILVHIPWFNQILFKYWKSFYIILNYKTVLSLPN